MGRKVGREEGRGGGRWGGRKVGREEVGREGIKEEWRGKLNHTSLLHLIYSHNSFNRQHLQVPETQSMSSRPK